MAWRPIQLSGMQRKRADRVGGIELIMPWPDGLPPGEALGEDEERDATAAEHAAAQQILGPACRRHDLVPVRSLAARIRRPPGPAVERPRELLLHLCTVIVGRRWVHARGAPDAARTWVAAGRIERE